jgi:DNA-binding NtrC family response regulator
LPPAIIPAHLPPHPILLVDDDPVLRETLTDLLRHEGFKVIQAASGEEAERHLLAAQPPIDLVLTDLVMPGKSGMDVLHTALEICPSCTVLVLSGFASVREATEAMVAGAYGIVTKPLHLDQFRTILRRLVERTDLLEEREALRKRVRALETKVEELEATKGRLEILAQRISPIPEAGSEALDDLERLAGLRARGMLSEDQFEGAKQALLNRWLT